MVPLMFKCINPEVCLANKQGKKASTARFIVMKAREALKSQLDGMYPSTLGHHTSCLKASRITQFLPEACGVLS
jgi:hypothetical protein